MIYKTQIRARKYLGSKNSKYATNLAKKLKKMLARDKILLLILKKQMVKAVRKVVKTHFLDQTRDILLLLTSVAYSIILRIQRSLKL